MKTLDDLITELEGDPAKGRCVFVRADLNVPLDGTTITDDGRIRASLPTLQRLRDAGARVVVAAHLGRPKPGADNSKYSLGPGRGPPGRAAGHRRHPRAARRRGEGGGRAADLRWRGAAGEHPVRPAGDQQEATTSAREFAGELAALTGTQGVFVSDGFGVVHRKQASVYDLARELPAYAGGLVLTEVEVLRKLTHDPQRPYAVVLGGSKVSDKLLVIESLLPQVDSLLVGGGMCFTFLAAQGLRRRRLAAGGGPDRQLPPAAGVRQDRAADGRGGRRRLLGGGEHPHGAGRRRSLTGGRASTSAPSPSRRSRRCSPSAKTVFWNGPMGVFELAPFAEGTRGVAEAIIETTAGKGDGTPGFSVVGGGDSAAAVRALGLAEDGFSHISTGGGASLEYLEGKVLPGIAVLDEEQNDSPIR